MDRDLDLAEALRAVGAAEDEAVDVDAGFFHRTLARWLGLPEGRPDVPDAVRWDYDFWKATFESLPAADDGAGLEQGLDDGRERFAADLFREKAGPVERVSWFVKKDARGRIVEAGWLSPAPQLVERVGPGTPLQGRSGPGPGLRRARVGADDGTDDGAATLDEETVRRLLDDDLDS